MMRCAVPIAVAVLGLFSASGSAAATTDQVYERFAPAVVQIRILNRASASRASLGTGFFVDRAGLVLTNYHVVSDVVQHPKKYAIEMTSAGAVPVELELLNVDVVHDLAVLQAPLPSPAVLELSTAAPRQGTRLFSLGNPYDLGTSIVEGTYNGLLEQSLYERIHFTGSINPGMSGGPTVDADGRVIGINVATAGNALSFLVPAKFAAALIAGTRSADFSKPASFTAAIREQLLQSQQLLADRLLAAQFDSITLGGFNVPSRFSPFLKCWGDEEGDNSKPYKVVVHSCSTNDAIYVAKSLSAGVIKFSHHWYSARNLNRFQFYSMYEGEFADNQASSAGSRDLVTRFECSSDFVRHEGVDMKLVLCLRAYKKMRGLYDAVLLGASLNSNDSGLQTKLEMKGISFDNAHLLARKFVDAITWNSRSS